MTGWRSKKLSGALRHADPVTLDHIIDLRKRLAEAERQRDNALDRCWALDKMVWDLRMKLVMKTNLFDERENDNDIRHERPTEPEQV